MEEAVVTNDGIKRDSEKEKVIVKVCYPKSGVPLDELANFFIAMRDSLPSFDVVLSNAPFGQGAN